jgi:pimeloyl-ACP methyl ester carboxylesterase
MNIVVNGLLAKYTQLGQGPVLVWLHGWGVDSSSLSRFACSVEGFTHVLLDLPGFGASQAPSSPWTVDDYAEFVVDFVQKSGLNVYGLVGHSNGGAIALLSSGRVGASKIVLLASAGVRGTSAQSQKRTKYLVLAKVGKVVTIVLPASYRTQLRKKLYASSGSEFLDAGEMGETYKLITGIDIRDKLVGIKIPVQLIYGALDIDTPPNYGQLLSDKLDKSQLHIVAEAGHYVFDDKPAEVRELMLKYLNL